MKYLSHFLKITMGLMPLVSFSQTVGSAVSFGSAHQDYAWSTAKSPIGDIYVTGGTTNQVDFNPNGTPHLVTVPEADKMNPYIAKYNVDMTLAWVISLGSSHWDEANKLLLDDTQNVYVLGTSYGIVDFDPSANVANLDLGDGNHFIAKYSSDGIYQDAALVPTVDYSQPGDQLLTDLQGNIYTYTGEKLNKFNSDLDLIWTQSIGGCPEIMNDTEIQCIKNFRRPGYIHSALGETQIILERYNLTTGSLIGTQVLGHTDNEINSGFIKKTRNNDLLIYGKFAGKMTLYGGGETLEFENYDLTEYGLQYEKREFICRYSSEGDLIWAKAYDDKGPNPSIIETDADGNIYTLGNLHYSANFDPVNPIIHTASNLFGSYIAKYDSDFNYISMYNFLGMHTGISDFKIYEDASIVCGEFYTPINVNLAGPSETLETNGYHDAFLIKYPNYDAFTLEPLTIDEHTVDADHFFTTHFKNSETLQITIDQNMVNVEENTVVVYDNRGRVLTSLTSSLNTFDIDMSAHPSAMYFVRVMNQERNSVDKIMKH